MEPMPVIPDILTARFEDEAILRLRNYFGTHKEYRRFASIGPETTSLPVFSGSRFDSFGRVDGDQDTVTPADLLSLAFLSVEVSAEAVIGILEQSGPQIEALLRQVPSDLALHTMDNAAFEQVLGASDSPGRMLWDILRAHHLPVSWGMGETRVSKLLARKRPHLIPIWDSHVGQALDLPHSGEHWIVMHSLLQDPELIERLARLRHSAIADRANVSLLRVFDVVVWHAQKYPGGPTTWPASDSGGASRTV